MSDARPDPGPPAADAFLAAIVAHHLDDGAVDVGTARAVSRSVVVECRVDDLSALGDAWSAACFFQVSGGRFGPTPVFASISGMGSTPEEAVAGGGSSWADMLASLLQVADGAEPAPDGVVHRSETTLDGRRFLLVVAGLDRALTANGAPCDPEADSSISALRHRLGGSHWLLPTIARDGRLPLLPCDDAVLVSLFVAELPTSRVVELKVHGADWDSTGVLDGPPERVPGLDGALLRELALLVPLEPPQPLTRSAVRRTLDGLASRREPRQAAGWQGWAAHRGVLGPVLSAAELAAVESGTGPLPADVRTFLSQVAGPGAGPGYGLLPLRAAHGVVPLAHAGCGNAWMLRLDGEARGTVWMDAAGSDETVTQVASSFTRWFSAWLDAAVRDDRPWVQWDVLACSPVDVLTQVLLTERERASAAGETGPVSLAGHLADGSLRISGAGKYVPPGPIDPCHGCVSIAASWSLPPTVFAAGPLSR